MVHKTKHKIKQQLTILISFVAVFWLLEIIDIVIFGGNLDRFGIRPTRINGLWGIPLAPFLHGGLGHLIANTIPFLILGWLVMVQRIRDFWLVTILATLIGGLGIWLFGAPNSVHIGASILIFGYLGFLLSRGLFQGNPASIALTVVTFLLYGHMIWGILPGVPHISWQGHLFGFLGGVFSARVISQNGKKDNTDKWV